MSNLFNPPNSEKLDLRIKEYEKRGKGQAAREAFERKNYFYAEELLHDLDWKGH